MIYMKALLLCLLCAQWCALAGTNFVIHISTNRIAIPIPDGYVELGPDRRKNFPADSPHALLGWFVRTNDLALFEPNATDFLRHHLQVQTLKQWTNKSMSDKAFAQFIEMNVKQSEERTDSIAAEVQALFKASGTNDTINVANPKHMGSFFKSERAYGSLLLVGYKVQTKDGTSRVPMVAGNAIVHIGNKCLFMYAYEYVSGRAGLQPALEAVRGRLKPWVEATLLANE